MIFQIKVYFSNQSLFFKSRFNLINRSLFLISKVILSNGNLSYRIKIYILSGNLYLLSSLPLSNCPSVTKKKIHCIVKVCSVFVVEWNWQLRGIFVVIAEQKKKKKIISIGDNTLTEREVIGYYFHCGYGYKVIAYLLKT